MVFLNIIQCPEELEKSNCAILNPQILEVEHEYCLVQFDPSGQFTEYEIKRHKDIPISCIAFGSIDKVLDHSSWCVTFFYKLPLNLMAYGKINNTKERATLASRWNFQDLDVGGLDDQLNDLFRRAFVSRVYPEDVAKKLGCKHVKGILLHGPPGTGKTLVARQLGGMLGAKMVNGPEVFGEWVGQSENNIRHLFADAEAEQERYGSKSQLHVVIFDEIDAICQRRGSRKGGSGVDDKVANQLLAMIDGVRQLDNILVIGITNRKDLIDEALLRPGRLEVQIEIGLPSQSGRRQILEIHTAGMKYNGMMGDDVDLEELAEKTRDFSGADIEGLVRAAQSLALNSRLVKSDSEILVDLKDVSDLKVGRNDFLAALGHVKPVKEEQIEAYLSNGIVRWGQPITSLIQRAEILIRQAQNQQKFGLVSLLLEGAPGTGTTALAAHLAAISDFPFVGVCSPDDLILKSDWDKCQHIDKVFNEAYRSQLGCIVVDSIERLIGDCNSSVLQTLQALLFKQPPKNCKLFVVGTTHRKDVLKNAGLLSAFTKCLHVPNLSSSAELKVVLEQAEIFHRGEVEQICEKIAGRCFSIGIKKLLMLIETTKEVKEKERPDFFVTQLKEDGYLSEQITVT